ncbi:MAG: hypothetical protein ACM3OF_13355, partial [Gemmatimonas sp.]
MSASDMRDRVRDNSRMSLTLIPTTVVGRIGIGGSLAASPLPHHRTYGSVSGGSVDYAGCCAATEAKPSALKNAIGMA